MKHLSVSNSILLQGRPFTYLTAQSAAGATTLAVENANNLAINQILSLGEIGNQGTEIVKTHASAAVSGLTITLTAALARTHAPYKKVSIILYDQVEFSHASTITGSKTVLVTKNLDFSKDDTTYDDTANSSGYYFVRFKNSIDSTFSEYSDAIPFAGLDGNTLGFAINYAMKRNKMTGFTESVDHKFFVDEANDCLEFIAGKMKGWTKLQILNAILGQTAYGTFKVALPSDIWENKGLKSILGLRVGSESDMSGVPWYKLEKRMRDLVYTQVRTQATAGDTTLAIDNSYDFADSGSVNVYISGTLYTITYTGVTRSSSSGVLTGIPASGTGAITVTIPVDTYVFYGETTGEPDEFSVDSDGNIVFYPLCGTTFANKNIFIDYYTGPTTVDSDSDELDAFRYAAVKHWLTWAVRMQKKNDGKRDLTDGDYVQFLQIVSDYIRAEKPNNRKNRRILSNGIFYRNR